MVATERSTAITIHTVGKNIRATFMEDGLRSNIVTVYLSKEDAKALVKRLNDTMEEMDDDLRAKC